MKFPWPLLAVLLVPQDPDGAALLAKCDETLSKAKTIQVKIYAKAVVTMGRTEDQPSSECTLTIKNPGKYRLEGKAVIDGVERREILTCDGEATHDSSSPDKARKPMKDAVARLTLLVSRMGLQTPSLLSVDNPDKDAVESGQDYIPDLKKLVTWSEVKFAGREKVDDVETLKVTAVATWRKRGEEADSKAEFTTWIDPKTSLPVKRVAVHASGESKMTCAETYEGWKLGDDVADELFKKK